MQQKLHSLVVAEAHTTRKVSYMKLVKSVKQVIHFVGSLIAIGARGVAVSELKELPAPLKLGTQPILAKTRGDDVSKELWVRSCSWLTPKTAKKPEFTLLPLPKAVSSKLVKLHKGMRFRTLDGKTHTGTIVAPYSWEPSMRQPQYLGVVDCRTYRHGRIESRLVRESDGSESRNKSLVAKLVLK